MINENIKEWKGWDGMDEIMNPMMLIQIKEKIDIFREQHPRMIVS